MEWVLPVDDAGAVELEQQVFNGLFDVVSRKGEPAQVIQQEWDQKKWFYNSGGSHRSSALWLYDHENGIERPINCILEEVKIHHEFRAFTESHDMWIFQIPDATLLTDLYHMINTNRDEKSLFEGFNLRYIKLVLNVSC